MHISAPTTTPTDLTSKVAQTIRELGAGFRNGARLEGVQADKAAIHPFETVATLTSLLKNSTSNIKFVNKATSLVHTIGGFALLIAGAQASGALKAPGDTLGTMFGQLADVIDGTNQSQGAIPPWFATVLDDAGEATIAPSGMMAQMAAAAANSNN
ncbi:MAG: hypothetical protein JWM90_907 [Thermoleophilia bacterium]|nr:hypothetical protein [Thermoleophilia bacterium]